ncbi:TetR/AcrR family transcriptional regulator [Georgenia wutianyii]|uniref:TetR/AcrR family transcriptional regulator n=1 Tax=Georgenia wutianyii TaxID=2585135 RepID=A0ABX5VKR0_9MICO|nr:TetR family transcriptional regulator [Georgenia wutianyii]QDB78738.1 TetR/AcrR family transcriptional regulator [Georgenia wutianyii]
MTDDPAGSRRRPTGRRPGDSGTREAILDSALALFAERGYEGASIRAIATDAGVDPALIRHFFGDKDTLFAVAVSDRTAIPERLAASLAGAPQEIGHRVTDSYLRMWDEPQTRRVLLALVRSTTTAERAADMVRDLLGAHMHETTGITAEDPRMLGVALAASHLLGVALARHVIRVPALATMDHAALVDQVAPAVQHYLGNVLALPGGARRD